MKTKHITLAEKLLHLKEKMRISEIANDSYYLSQEYKEDIDTLYHLQKLLEKDKDKTYQP